MKPARVYPESNRRGFVQILTIVLLILIAALGVVAYLQSKPKSQTQNQPATQLTTPDPTVYTDAGSANWKTYTNARYGFTLKHPSTLVSKEEQNGEIQLIINFTSPKNEFVIDITKEDAIPNWPGNSDYRELKTINGISWKVFPSFEFCDAGECSDTSVLYRVSHNAKSFHVILKNIDEKTIDQILSTFKFTN